MLNADDRSAAGLIVREGLPSTYRMRADAHYVDQLDALPAASIQMLSTDLIEADEELAAPNQSLLDSIACHGILEPLLVQKRERRHRLVTGRKRLAAARTLGVREVPCVVRRLDDEQIRSLAATNGDASNGALAQAHAASVDEGALATALTAVLSCADLVVDGVPPLTRQVALDMIRVETQRTLCALRTAEVLKGRLSGARRPVHPRKIVTALVSAIAPEARLRGTRVATRLTVGEDVVVDVDERELVPALSAVVLMLFAGLDDVQGATLEVNVTAEASEATIELTLDSVIVPSSWLTVTADGFSTSNQTLAPLVALRQIAQRHDGKLAIKRLARGTQVAVALGRHRHAP